MILRRGAPDFFFAESSLSELQNTNTPTGSRIMLQQSSVAMPDPRKLARIATQVEKRLKGPRACNPSPIKKAPTEADAPGPRFRRAYYIYSSEQVLVAASHMPPAFWQSVFAVGGDGGLRARPLLSDLKAAVLRTRSSAITTPATNTQITRGSML